MNVARAPALSRRESWSDRDVASRRGAPVDHRGDRLRRDEHGLARCAGRGAATLELGRRDVAGGDYGRQHPREPSLVVRHPQVLGGRQHLDAMAKRIEVPQAAAGPKYARERIHPSLPALVERALAGLVPDRPHALHAAHVMNAVHAGLSAELRVTRAVPIIESRVTSAANASSLRRSLPAGRSGSTMYRTSDVLSQTRTSTSAPMSTPNSFSTPRGSMTARERYGADLYHTGGRPRSGHG